MKLNYVSIEPIPNIFGGFKANFASSSQDAIKDGMYGNINIHMSSKYKDKPRGVEFYISPSNYAVKVTWKLKLND